MPDILDAPEAAEPTIPEDAVFDPAALDPSTMMQAPPVVKPAAVADPPEPGPDSKDTKPEPVADPAAVAKPEPVIRDSDEPRNVAELRRNYKQAKADRDQLKTDRDSLAAKLADLEPKATNYEKERAALQQRLDEREAALEERDAALRRAAIKETPQWQALAEPIREAAKLVRKIAEMPELRDAGLSHNEYTLLDPSQTDAINATLQALEDSGKRVEAKQLMKAHDFVVAQREVLRKLEADGVEEAKEWGSNRETILSNTFRSVRQQIAEGNPYLNTQSAEFLAMGKEQQEYVTGQYKDAETATQEILGLKPDAMAAEVYRSALAVRLTSKANETLQNNSRAAEAKIAELTQKLAAYEAAAGAGGAVGGTRAGGPAEPTNPEDIAASLDPTNLPGYGGFGR